MLPQFTAGHKLPPINDKSRVFELLALVFFLRSFVSFRSSRFARSPSLKIIS